jgi:DNA-binding transcriptional LysR family regulator
MKRTALTPEAIETLILVAREGSFAGAARKLGKVPSALTYSMRQLEEELDVLLFDRSSKNAVLTPAGRELLEEGERLLLEMDSVANRVKRIATGWEPEFTIAFDGLISQKVLLELVQQFLATNPPTRLRLRHEILSGTWEALIRGQADLAIGVSTSYARPSGFEYRDMGNASFVFVVSPTHPLAKIQRDLTQEDLMQHRAIAIADTASQLQPMTVGLLPGQDVLTVPTSAMKIQAQVMGLGCGFISQAMVEENLKLGTLIEKNVAGMERSIPIGFAWRSARIEKTSTGHGGLAMQWWLKALAQNETCQAMIQNH